MKAYNWAANPGTSLGRLQYIPTLWGDAASWTDSWFDDARAGIAAGARHLFSFNEPDLVSQANMSPEVAVGAWMTYMEPFAGEVQLARDRSAQIKKFSLTLILR